MADLPIRSPAVSAAVALMVTLLFLHDVVFLGRSLLAADYTQVLRDETVKDKPTTLWHIGNSRSAGYRRHDTGASAWQFEPSLHFMTRTIWNRQTPYWNPYVATGALGPETLADMKFSAATLATAALGGSSLAYHIVFFFTVFLSSYAIIRLCVSYFSLSSLATIAALAAFLLGGYVQINLINALFIFIYLVTPIVLYALLGLAREQSLGRFLLATAANVMLFSFTFTPTLVLAAGFTQALCVIFIFTEVESARRLPAFAVANIAVPLLTLLLLAPLYVPIVASFADTVSLDHYLSRGLHGFRLRDIPKLFVPAGYNVATFRSAVYLPTLGAIAALLACIGVTSNGPHRGIRWGLAAASLLGLVVAFGMVPAALLEQIPILRTIKLIYWGYLFCVPIPFLVGFGVAALQRRERLNPLLALAAIGIAASFIFDFAILSHTAPPWAHWNFAIAAALFAGALLTGASTRSNIRFGTCAIVALLIADGLLSTNFHRPPRLNKGAEPPQIIAWIRDTLQGPDQARILNIGRRSLYPDWADALGVAQVGTMNMSELRWYARFYKTHIGNEWRFLSLGRDLNYVPLFTDATLDLIGVRFVMVDKNQRGAQKRIGELGYPLVREDSVRQIYENPGYLERCTIASALLRSKHIPGELGITLDTATTNDARLLQAAQSLGITDRPSGRAGTAKITEYRNGKVAIRAELDRPGILVVSDAWHPQWKAKANGKGVYVGRVNGAFRGIVLPAGAYHIVMTYNPRLFVESLVLAALGVAGLTTLAAWLWRRAPSVAREAG